MMYQLVEEFGLSPSGPLSDEGVMGYMTSINAYAHNNGEVRDAAKALAVLMYSLRGKAIERHLAALRPQQLREYQQAFEKGPPPAGSSWRRVTIIIEVVGSVGVVSYFRALVCVCVCVCA